MTVMEQAAIPVVERKASYGWIGAIGPASVWGRLRDGTTVRIRLICPEDEPGLHDLAAHMSDEDLRLRFLAPVKGLSSAVAARLSLLVYDRDFGLLAERHGLALAMAHLFTDLESMRAEYAIAVRSDWKGRGLGCLLMMRLIDLARQRGIGELVGEVLRENVPMLRMCRKLGFAVSLEPSDFSIFVATKRLAENYADCRAGDRLNVHSCIANSRFKTAGAK